MRTSIHIAAAVGLTLGIASTASTAIAAPSDSSDFPPAYVDRPLTLPKLMLSPEFSLPIIHAESAGSAFGSATANLVGLNLGAALGITDDFQIDTTPLTLLISDVSVPGFGSQTKVYYGTFHLGAMYRFVGRNAQLAKSDVAEVGARIEFGASGLNDTIHLTWGIPVILHFAKLVRIDTGLFFTGAFPVKGTSPQNDIGMGSVGSTPAILGAVEPPGIPLSVTLGNDFIFGGVDLGFGIASFRGSDISRNCYMPLGFHLGGTIPKDQKPLIDITGNFSFPYFLLGADPNPPTSRLWMVGLDAKGYFQL